MKHKPQPRAALRAAGFGRRAPEGPDFVREDGQGDVLYPATDKAQEWIDENVAAADVLMSGGFVADDEIEDEISRAGLTIDD